MPKAKSNPKPKQDTTTKQSSGLGYQVENEAVAFVLAHILARATPFGRPGGLVERVDTQRPATEWHLDDILVTARAHGVRHRLAFSAKSNRQITTGGFPAEFVREAWRQILEPTSAGFDENLDFLGLMTAPLGADLAEAVETLLREARDRDPADLTRQLHLPDRSNPTVRALLDSARCPDDLATAHGIDSALSAGRLLKRMLWVGLDFESTSSARRQTAVQLCQRALASGSADEAEGLWTRLKEVGDILRAGGGGADLRDLVGHLRGRFNLRDFPDHAADWDRIDEDTRSVLGRVRTSIGGKVTLARSSERAAMGEAFRSSRVAVLLGASGMGKSAVAKRMAEDAMASGKALWLNAARLEARSIAEWRPFVGLTNSMASVIGTAPTGDALIVLDGLDRLYSEDGFDTAAEFVRAAAVGTEGSPWRLLVTCTPESWERVRGALLTRGVDVGSAVPVTLGPPALAELAAVWEAFPSLDSLRRRRHLGPVLLRPKVLDLLASNQDVVDAADPVSESDVARLFWEREVAPDGPGGLARAEAAGRLAIHLADRLRSTTPASTLASDLKLVDVSPVDALVEGRVVVRADGEVAFDHDLYGDWVRAKLLRDYHDGGRLASFLTGKTSSPVWGRAVRLLGVDLLEQRPDVADWGGAFDALGALPDRERQVAQDAFLESAAFAGGGGLLRAGLWERLSADDGALLVRLLRRLGQTATVPNTLVVEAAKGEDPEFVLALAASARLPYWPYWAGLIALLHLHRDEIPSRARGLAAGVADLWLRSAPLDFPSRAEAAATAVALGDTVLREKEGADRMYVSDVDDQKVYRAVLAAGHEEPDRVTQIVLEAAGRRAHRFDPTPPTDEEIAALRTHVPFPPSIFDSDGPLAAPWPHGPQVRVDGAIQEAVWSTDALRPLAVALPDIAREVLLAVLIKEPEPERYFDDRLESYGLEYPPWNPEFYTHGPFLSLLKADEAVAVTAILQLVEHATDRWAEGVRRWRREQGDDEGTAMPAVEIPVDGEWVPFTGNSKVFGWAFYGPDHGHVIGCALGALEKHLYDLTDAGEDITDLLGRLLRSRHLAIVGLLSLAARYRPRYLTGPLAPLLVVPEIQAWTLTGNVQELWWLGQVHLPDFLHETFRAWHEMQHRQAQFLQAVPFVFATEPALHPLFESARERIAERSGAGGPYERWQIAPILKAMLDASNYTPVTDGEGREGIAYIPPAELIEGHESEAQAVQDELLLTALPSLVAEAYDVGANGEGVDAVWDQADRLGLTGDDGDSRDEERVALAALAFAPGAPTPRADRLAWARRIILDAAQTPNTDPGLESFVGAMMRAPVVLPRAVAALWAQDPADHEARKAVGRHLMLSPPADLAALCSTVRGAAASLGDDRVGRLVHAVLQRAVIDRKIRSAEAKLRFSSDPDDETDWAVEAESARRELAAVAEAFVDETIPSRVPDLDSLAPVVARRPGGGPSNRRPAPHRRINERLVAVAFMAIPDSGLPGGGWYELVRRYAEQTFGPMAQSAGERTESLEGTPSALDYDLLDRLAGAVARSHDADAAEALWHPVVDLGASAKLWVTTFAHTFIPLVISPGASPVAIESWRRMISYALSHPRWVPGTSATFSAHESGELWRSLLGLSSLTGIQWGVHLKPVVNAVASELESWASRYLNNADTVRVFAHVLAAPAFADLTLKGLGWFEAAAEAYGLSFWGRPSQGDRADDALATFLSHVWLQRRDELRRDAGATSNFRSLLARLVGRQHPTALELFGQVGTSGI